MLRVRTEQLFIQKDSIATELQQMRKNMKPRQEALQKEMDDTFSDVVSKMKLAMQKEVDDKVAAMKVLYNKKDAEYRKVHQEHLRTSKEMHDLALLLKVKI